jgi:hypothetical protein
VKSAVVRAFSSLLKTPAPLVLQYQTVWSAAPPPSVQSALEEHIICQRKEVVYHALTSPTVWNAALKLRVQNVQDKVITYLTTDNVCHAPIFLIV